MSDLSDERIRARAYELWERAGRPEAQDEAFWLQARLALQSEDQADELEGELPDVVLRRAG